MTASISARGNADAALSYYSHLAQDNLETSRGQKGQAPGRDSDYYLKSQDFKDGPEPGRWAGKAADRLRLKDPIHEAPFKAALTGYDPLTQEQLVKKGGNSKVHSSGWDMTFSAPKAVSVVWALSPEKERQEIQAAQQKAVAAASSWLEDHAAFARRGKAGKIKEATAGLLMAQFDHETSRDLDPQLHTHSFIFNMAPRKDGTWGAIVSRDLYRAQKQADHIYLRCLRQEMDSLGYDTRDAENGFGIKTVPLHVEKAFSKRQQAINEEVEKKGYSSARLREIAALQTRRKKVVRGRNHLLKQWRKEARDMGFDVKQFKTTERLNDSELIPSPEKNPSTCSGLQVTGKHRNRSSPDSPKKQKNGSPSSDAAREKEAIKVGRQLGLALLAFKHSGNQPGLRLALTSKTGHLSLKYEEDGPGPIKRRKDRENDPENEAE
ncbi:MobF family relaxase [Emcibacter nanhaiensis]|uniref:Conjugative relaxase n=1 Tax=Emcibacter nanhaiensis TaxID=1505037 RepID=A0A501PQJ4_9PROT|nr:MobF family relaxase [Emcibacter nanhaiensis]TPD62733.1 conjugative relaxase [Emcibacter nanhaiensis]